MFIICRWITLRLLKDLDANIKKGFKKLQALYLARRSNSVLGVSRQASPIDSEKEHIDWPRFTFHKYTEIYMHEIFEITHLTNMYWAVGIVLFFNCPFYCQQIFKEITLLSEIDASA